MPGVRTISSLAELAAPAGRADGPGPTVMPGDRRRPVPPPMPASPAACQPARARRHRARLRRRTASTRSRGRSGPRRRRSSLGLVVGVLRERRGRRHRRRPAGSSTQPRRRSTSSATSCSTVGFVGRRAVLRRAQRPSRGPRTSAFAGSRSRSASARSWPRGVGYYVVTAIYQSLVQLHGSDKLPQSLGRQQEHGGADRRRRVRLRGRADRRGVLLPRVHLRRAAPVAHHDRRARPRDLGRRGRHRDPVRPGAHRLGRRAVPDPARLPRLRAVPGALADRARCIRAWRCTRSTTRSRSGSTSCTGTPARSSRCWRPR